MRLLCTLIVIISIGHIVHGQPTEGQCYYSSKGLKSGSRLIILPLESNHYVLEFYQYGMGVFMGLPYKDTLEYQNGVFTSADNKVVVSGDRLKVTTKDGSRGFKYSVRGQCDDEINWTRNWSVRETERYKIKNQEKSSDFRADTDYLLTTLCHSEFLTKLTEIKAKMNLSQ